MSKIWDFIIGLLVLAVLIFGKPNPDYDDFS